MAFKPASSGKGGNGNNDFEWKNLPTPKSGQRPARVSLIVDLGVQDREDFEDPDTGELKPQKPCHQVAVFADLVRDVVDYGGDIGKNQYRLLLNKSFKGDVQGINFTTTPPKDAKGKLIDGKPWGLHPANLITKLAKAVDLEEIIFDDRKNPASLDIELLLNEAFMAQVEVKETESDKEDKDGNKIVYKNVNYKGAAPVPMMDGDDGEEVAMDVPELRAEALCITFDSAKPEHIKFIRGNLLKKIKTANNYAGSQMEKAVKAFEASQDKGGDEGGESADKQPAEKPAKETPAKEAKPSGKAAEKAAAKAAKANDAKPSTRKAQPAPEPEEEDDPDVPF
jgi:hypothetical protein